MISSKKIDKFYGSLPAFINRYDKVARQMPLDASNIENYFVWKKKIRKKLLDITGISCIEKSELKPELLEVIQKDGYKREKYIIQSEKDVWIPFYVLIPDDVKPDEKRPAVIAPHGHGGGGKLLVVGETSIPEIKKHIVEKKYSYGLDFVRQGYIVFCPDARGFGERRVSIHQSKEQFMNKGCDQLSRMGLPFGISVTGMWTFDLMRLIDYIETRNDVDEKRIASGGLSGGGLQTLWLAALDDRIKCCIVSGYFYGYKDSLLTIYNNCSCNYVPHLFETIDMCDLGALIMPRALLIETGLQDHLNGHRGLDNVTEQIEITKTAYALEGKEDRVIHHTFNGPHRWDGANMPEFLKQYL